MSDATGIVSRSVTKERLEGTTVEARKGTDTERTVTDKHGKFELQGLEEGEWSFVGLEADSIPNKAKKLKHPDETTDISITLLRREGNQDRVAGYIFFVGLLLAFALLVALYVVLHVRIRQGPVPLSATIPVALDLFEEQVTAAAKAEDKVAEGAVLLAALDDIGTDVEAVLEERKDLSEQDRLQVTARVLAIKKSLAEDKVEGTLAVEEAPKLMGRIGALREIIEAPGERAVGIWARDPLRIIEVLLWGLAGILVNKIIFTGWYLRRRTFYREGIVMHIAHIVGTPVMVLVVVFLLSLVTLKITLAGGNELALDLSDPRVMVAFSFLLGTIPWPLWNFIESTAKKFPSGIG